MIPKAYARRRLNHCPTTATEGVNLARLGQAQGMQYEQRIHLHHGISYPEKHPLYEEKLIWTVLLAERHEH